MNSAYDMVQINHHHGLVNPIWKNFSLKSLKNEIISKIVHNFTILIEFLNNLQNVAGLRTIKE